MKENNLSRRHFLGMVGAAGGSTAVYQTAMAMDLMQETGPVAMLDLDQRVHAASSISRKG